MGAVFKATDRRLLRPVAIKFLNRELTSDDVARQRFNQEARAASALDHPNLCTIFEIGETDDGQLFIVMAYYEGETVKTRIAQRQLSPAEAADIAIQAAAGLTVAHRAGIVHRDIKPDNLMLTGDGMVKILDFGVAKLSGAEAITQEGVAVGSVAYMAPEQIRGNEVDHRADIWSLGVVLYEMVSGKLPFGMASEPATFLSILTGEPESLAGLDEETERVLCPVVDRALAKEAMDRFDDAAEMARQLSALGSVTSPTISMPIADRADRGPSIAVLPFTDLSSDRDQEYFCDGVAEELIGAMAQVRGLRVVSRTSSFQFKGRQEDARAIGRKLGVSTLLDGSVRKAGEKLRITVQLVNVSDGFQLWSGRFDREIEDIFAVQDEIARTVVQNLEGELGEPAEAPLVEHFGGNLEAYNCYLKGRYNWNKRTDDGLASGVEHFQGALEIEPDYPRALAGLADSFALQGIYGFRAPRESMPKARKAALQALTLDDSLAEVHVSLGCIKAIFDHDWRDSERAFVRALELNANYATAHHWYAINCLVPQSRFDEARTHLKKARALDPLSLAIQATIGLGLYYEHRFDAAIAEYRRALEIEPAFAPAHFFLGLAYSASEIHDRAVSSLREAVRLSDGSIETTAALGYAYAVAGRRADASEILTTLREVREEQFVSPNQVAIVLAGLDREDEALDELERAYEERASDLAWIAVRPTFGNLRAEPRFAKLLERMGLRGGGEASVTVSELPTGRESR